MAGFYGNSLAGFSRDLVAGYRPRFDKGTAAKPGSFNKYGYVQGNPVNAVDSSGKEANPACMENMGIPDVGPIVVGVCDAASSTWEWFQTTPTAASIAEFGQKAIDWISTTVPQIPIFLNKAWVSYWNPVHVGPSAADVVQPIPPPNGNSGSTPTPAPNSPTKTPTADNQPTPGCAVGMDSFSADTLVDTKDGQKPISSIKVGDQVLAYNPDTGKDEYETVDAVMVHTDPIVENLTISGETVHTTPEHPFYTLDRGWIKADDLKQGEMVEGADARYGIVQAIVVIAKPQVMYNLTVHKDHTFFVGSGHWLVHNANYCLDEDGKNAVLEEVKNWGMGNGYRTTAPDWSLDGEVTINKIDNLVNPDAAVGGTLRVYVTITEYNGEVVNLSVNYDPVSQIASGAHPSGQ